MPGASELFQRHSCRAPKCRPPATRSGVAATLSLRMFQFTFIYKVTEGLTEAAALRPVSSSRAYASALPGACCVAVVVPVGAHDGAPAPLGWVGRCGAGSALCWPPGFPMPSRVEKHRAGAGRPGLGGRHCSEALRGPRPPVCGLSNRLNRDCIRGPFHLKIPLIMRRAANEPSPRTLHPLPLSLSL